MNESELNKSEGNSYLSISSKKLARFAGILFLLQLIPYYLGHEVILGSFLYQEDLISAISQNRSQIAFAVLLEMLSAFSFIVFSVILYQMLKQTNLLIARLYLGIRFVEFTIIILSEIKLMSLVSISKLYASTGEDQVTLLKELGSVYLYEWQWITLIYMMVFCINALFFYYLLFKSKLVPGFISIWGGIGAILAISTPILLIYGKPTAGFVIYAPIGLNELFLALWLIFRGVERQQIRLTNQSTKE